MSIKSLALISPPVRADFPKERLIRLPREAGCVPCFTLICLASYIKEKQPSAEIFIFDGEAVSLDRIFFELERCRPQVIAISSNCVTYVSGLKIARLAKKLGSQIILGGHHATALAREIILNRGPHSDDYCVDAVVVQDGEEALLGIVSQKPFSQIPNLVYQAEDDIVFNEIKTLDINQLPFSDFSLASKEGISIGKFLWIFSRRGCRWRAEKGACLFCLLMQKDFRCKTPLRFYQEIDALVKKYHPETIFEVSDDFLDDFKWLDGFHRLYKNYSPKPKIMCFGRIDNFVPEIVKKLTDIGVTQIIFGVESNDNEMLGALGKGSSEQKNREAIELLNVSGMTGRINFVIGGINESRESCKRTLEFAEWTQKLLKNRALFNVDFLHPYPGSRAFSLLVKKTGGKYLNQDILDYRQLMEDWFGYFCRISYKEASKFIDEINYLNKGYFLN